MFGCIFLIMIGQFIVRSSSHCIMEGPCKEGQYGDISCAKTFEPKPLVNESAINLLKVICPYFGSTSNLCCNDKQVERLQSNLKIASTMMKRCPACFENFKRVFCNFACSPNQDGFLNITTVERTRNGQDLIREITYFIKEHSAVTLYESCRNVQGLTHGSTIMSMFCGPWGERDCTARRWLDFVGSDNKHGGFNEFQMDFRYLGINETFTNGSESFNGLDLQMTTCDSPDGIDGIPCTCSDCVQACNTNRMTLPPIFQREEKWRLFGYDAMVFLVVFCCCSLVAVVSMILIVQGFQHIGYPRPRSIIRRAGNKCILCVSDFFKMFVFLEIIGTCIENKFKKCFEKWGTIVSHYPVFVLVLSLLVAVGLSSGLVFFKVTTNPTELWVSADSKARQDMDYFNENFRPFYRTQQLIIVPQDDTMFTSNTTNEDGGNLWGPAFRQDFLLEVRRLQRHVEGLVATSNNREVKLEDICLSPLRPMYSACAVQSILAFYYSKNTPLESEHYLEHFKECVKDLSNRDCYGAYGGPLTPVEIALGDMEKSVNGTKYYTARALVITIPVMNNLDKNLNQDALSWEKEFINFMKDFKHPNMSVAFRAERSVEDELDRGSQADKMVVILSYAVMFIYISVSLGELRSYKYIMIDTKITLGVVGVLMVILSITSSLGIFCYLDKPASLIVIQVLPFLILAVGVDNVYLLVHTFQNDKRQEQETLEDQIGRVVGEIAPSMLLSSTSMSACFFIGASSTMPVIRVFALYAGVAIVINFILQITGFLAIFTFDAKRQDQNRFDILCCFQSSTIPPIPDNEKMSYMNKFFQNWYAPFLMKRWVRIAVLVIFLTNLLFAVSFIYNLEIGFEQEAAMPDDSYLQMYFKYLAEYLSVGPPLYFIVTDGYNYSNPVARRRICGMAGCDVDSAVSIIAQMSRHSNRTYIAVPSTSWIDDYVDYMRSDHCCRKYANGSFCPSSKSSEPCETCLNPPSIPIGEEFNNYITFFLDDLPNDLCPKAGRALFQEAVKVWNSSMGNGTHIGPTYFMSYHTSLKNSQENTMAIAYARYFAKLLKAKLRGNDSETADVEVRSYSVTHVFYEQYLTIWNDTLRSLSFSLLAIFIVIFIFMGLDLFSATIVTLTIIMIVITVMGMMQWWHIPLNALSLVNLVVAVGISVEFCSHLTLSFSRSSKIKRVDRAQDAIGKLGRSIISGITLTDSGVLILVFAKSTIFQVYYFRMYLGIILFGTLHSIIFLPVLLSWAGPPKRRTRRSIKKQRKSEEEISQQSSFQDSSRGDEFSRLSTVQDANQSEEASDQRPSVPDEMELEEVSDQRPREPDERKLEGAIDKPQEQRKTGVQ